MTQKTVVEITFQGPEVFPFIGPETIKAVLELEYPGLTVSVTEGAPPAIRSQEP